MAGRNCERCRPSRYSSVRRGIGRGHQAYAAAKQALQQFAEDHGIADLGHEELVETDDAGLVGQFVGDDFQRIGFPYQGSEAVVHPVHQAMKVIAQLVVEGQGLEKHIHDEGLAPADAAPQIGTPGRCHPGKPAGQAPAQSTEGTARGDRCQQFGMNLGKLIHRHPLGWVCHISVLR